MERLTSTAEGYCEMYCSDYIMPGCDPEKCAHKNDVAMYEALKSIEGIVQFDRLRELAQADREGRVVVLPCKVGDTIYKIPSETNHALNKISGHAENNRVYEQKVCRAEVYENGVFCLVTCDGMDSVHSAFYNVDWFLTREEAEKALEARKGAEHEN